MDGLFKLANSLFGIEIEPADGVAPVNLVLFRLAMILEWGAPI